MSQADLITDKELWQIVDWNPTSQQDRGRLLFPGTPDIWLGKSQTPDNTPSEAWRKWAKGEIQQAGQDQVLYLCRLLRLLEIFHMDATERKPGVEPAILYAAFVSGYAIAGVDRQSDYAEVANSEAEVRHLILVDGLDEWRPGMASGSGWKNYIRLTVAGRRLVESFDSAPPPPLYSTTIKDAPTLPSSSPSNPVQCEHATVKIEVKENSPAPVPSNPPCPEQPLVASEEEDATHSESTLHPLTLANTDRDQWIYDQCVGGIPYKNIRTALKKRIADGWMAIKSDQGIIRAAQRYAERHSLPLPEPRQQGRPREQS